MNISIALMIIKNQLTSLKKTVFCSQLKSEYPNDKEKGRRKKVIELFNITNGGEVTKIF